VTASIVAGEHHWHWPRPQHSSARPAPPMPGCNVREGCVTGRTDPGLALAPRAHPAAHQLGITARLRPPVFSRGVHIPRLRGVAGAAPCTPVRRLVIACMRRRPQCGPGTWGAHQPGRYSKYP
jgi:hypothetical protein